MSIGLDIARLHEALILLDRRLEIARAPSFEILVCGGAALLAAGLGQRTTRDVDILSLMDSNRTASDPDPLPGPLLHAASEVEAILGLPRDWLNNQPSRGDGGLFRMGLPTGIEQRAHRKRPMAPTSGYGSSIKSTRYT